MEFRRNVSSWLLCFFIACLITSITHSFSVVENDTEAMKVRLEMVNMSRRQTSRKVGQRPRSNLSMEKQALRMVEDFATKIAGGYPAPISTYIHVAYVVVARSDGRISSCTGTIINSITILSAAHCFPSGDDGVKVRGVTIRAGETSNSETMYTGKSVVVFKKYKTTSNQHDLAIVTLFKPLNKKFRPIDFPSCNRCFPQPGLKVLAAGFGITDSDGSDTNRLLETSLVVRPFSLCKRTYNEITNSTARTRFGRLHMFCAMDKKFPDSASNAVCKGDSGGPIFVKGGGARFIQLGLTSFGSAPCNKKGAVDWFVNLSLYQTHITNFLKGREGQWRAVFKDLDA